MPLVCKRTQGSKDLSWKKKGTATKKIGRGFNVVAICSPTWEEGIYVVRRVLNISSMLERGRRENGLVLGAEFHPTK